MTREPTVEELVGETTNNDDENVGNFNMDNGGEYPR